MIPAEIPDHRWKDAAFVEQWKRDLEKSWRERQLREIFKPSPAEIARGAIHLEDDTLSEHCDRLEPGRKKKSGRSADQARHQVPALIAHDGGGWILHPATERATPAKLTKSKRMYDNGLEKKAEREIACGLLGGEIECRTGHKFRVAYQCGNRYCPTCAPKDGKKLFARQANKLRFAATRLMLCGEDECPECSAAIEEKRLPHWPPARTVRPRIVCATIDFTLRHDKTDGLPKPERMRELNRCIKKFCRTIEKRFKITRKEYGLAFCDELGGNNSNPHAHGIYVGPWLPQSKEKKELSELWREITGGDSFILSIKFAKDFGRALFHALKYPAKFAIRSSPERLADLESVFHRVRRFHTLAAFYAPEAPADPKPEPKSCPLCGSQLSEPRGWQTIAALVLRGLRDLDSAILAAKQSAALRAPP